VLGNCSQAQEGRIGAGNSAKIAMLRPDAQSMANNAMAIAGARGTTLFIAETRRTEQRQNDLYKQGRNGNPGPVVTSCQGAQCPHVEGRALDVYPVQDGRPLIQEATPTDMQIVGTVGEAAGFEWGGGASWRHKDRPHWEVPNP
jgi:peptidoglycan L-alanyl-D-glutamate endopeptidase CwlK